MDQLDSFYNQLMHYLVVSNNEGLIAKFDLDEENSLSGILTNYFPETEIEDEYEELDFIEGELIDNYYGIFLELVNHDDAREEIISFYENNMGQIPYSTMNKIPSVLKELAKTRPYIRQIRNKAGVEEISKHLYFDLVNNIEGYL